MAASPTNTAEQTLILNTAFDVSGDSGPLLANLDTFQSSPPWRRVSGDTAPLRVILVDDGGTVPDTPRRVILASGNTLSLTAKVDAADVDMALTLAFTQGGTEGAEYYEADPGTLAVSDTIFNGNPEVTLKVDFQEKTSGGTILRQWRASLILLWSTASGGTTSPLYYVGYNAQSPTAPQQAQALVNLGIPSGIANAVVSDGTITSANAGKVAVVGSTTKQIGAGVAIATAATTSTLVLRDASGGITVVGVVANGVSLEEGTVTAETGAFSGVVGADGGFTGGLTTPFTISGTGVATVRATAFFQGAVWFGMGAALSGQGSYVSENGLFLYGEGGTLTGSFSTEGGGISAASGAFSVSANGDMTATHGKFQGSGGQAGHIQLKQGTTPNGTANETTVWGIAGGIGWRDGTGTAYTLLLPTASGSTGVLASATEELAGTSSTVATSPATGHVKQLYQAYHIAFSAAAFAQAVSGTGASTGTTDWGVDVTGPTTAVGYGLRRNAPANSFAASRGKGRGVIAWGRRFEIVGTACIYAGLDANAVFRITFGKTTGDNAGNLARRGLGFRVQGTGALEIETHNGTTRTASTNSTFTPTANQAFDFRITSDGAGNCVLWINDAQVATCTGGPTTDSSSTENAFQIEIENVSTVTTQSSATAGNFGVYMARS